MPEKRTHDYVRHGTTSLFAAFDTADGTVISSLHRRHRAAEFTKFLTKIGAQVPDDLQVHLTRRFMTRSFMPVFASGGLAIRCCRG